MKPMANFMERFQEVLRERIPTPAEFVEFAKQMGWVLDASKTPPVLRGPKDDELAVQFAKMLSREPYRTNVLAHLRATETTTVPQPETPPMPIPTVEECKVCHREPITEEDKPHLANNPALCDRGDRGGGPDTVDRLGEVHQGSPRCPYKP